MALSSHARTAVEKLKGLIRRCSAVVQTPAAPALGVFSLAADLHGVILNPGGPQQGRVQHKQSLIVFDRASVVQARCCFCFPRFHRSKTASRFHSSLAFLFPVPCGVFFAVFLLWGVSESPPPTPSSPPAVSIRSGSPSSWIPPSVAAPFYARHGGLRGGGGEAGCPAPVFFARL